MLSIHALASAAKRSVVKVKVKVNVKVTLLHFRCKSTKSPCTGQGTWAECSTFA